MEAIYELWADGETGEVYAVRLEERRVTGYCGPLSRVEAGVSDSTSSPSDPLPGAAPVATRAGSAPAAPARPQPARQIVLRALQQSAARRRQAR